MATIMGWFSKASRVDQHELAELRAQVQALQEALATSERSRLLVEARVNQLFLATEQLIDSTSLLEDVTVRLAELDVVKRQVAHLDVVQAKLAALDSLTNRVSELHEVVATSNEHALHAKEQTVVLHERITNVSNEVINQINELGRELDALATTLPSKDGAFAGSQTLAADTLDTLKAAQVKLAQEQARYEIAFREDLSRLADEFIHARNADALATNGD
jgi:hypothetical protein